MEKEAKKQTRRSFLTNFGILGVFIVAMGLFIRNAIAYLFPEKKGKKYHKYLVGKENELPVGKAREITLGKTPVFLVHLKDEYRVFSGICTHLGCIVRWEEEKQRFYCPCHKGVFTSSGEVVSGPPPRPLDQYAVKVEKNLIYIQVEQKTGGPWV